ncbi:site-2 protease family protein [Haloarcula sediminis]|uniref:site-2 protease family protein n=1 Tax=Haloarcula sediminis TaxID=3111777 RepID=UPI00387EC819
MMGQESAQSPPGPERLADVFSVRDIDLTEGGIRYYGDPVTDAAQVIRQVGPTFRQHGYRVRLQSESGGHVLVATERSLGVDGVPWRNVALAAATLLSTLYAGTRWYGLSVVEEPAVLWRAWPFAAAVMGILAVHEFGHYALSRYHEVQASLPYFIPLPFNVIGTLGAVIRMQDNIPDRRALFDIGVAGPLAGLVATVAVTAVGVTLDPIYVAGGLISRIELGYPPLIQGIAALLGESLSYSDPNLLPNPVVIGGWVGAFVTFLNLIPVGQLDGAHISRSLVGERMDAVQLVVPLGLFGLAGYLVAFEGGRGAPLWGFWGVIALVFSRAGTATPLVETPLGPRRRALGVLTLVLGALCFVPVPIVVAV